MKKLQPILSLLFLLVVACQPKQENQNIVSNTYQNVNPFIGTDAHGHTYPGATVPFGLVQLSPDTRTLGWDASGGYHYSDSTLLGFSHTHLSGTGCSDLADILVTPGSTQEAIPFLHTDEVARPGYYSVQLKDPDVLVELTATPHCGMHRYTFQSGEKAQLIFDLQYALDKEPIHNVRLQKTSDYEIIGSRNSDGWIKGQSIYFVAFFNHPIKEAENASSRYALDSSIPLEQQTMHLSFGEEIEAPLVCTVGISYVSIDNARENLLKEIGTNSFDTICERAERSWNKRLTAIQVEGGTLEDRQNLATALYHTMVVPNQVSDVNGQHPLPDGSIGEATHPIYSTLSLWDTFRTWNPMMTLLDTTMVNHFIGSMLDFNASTGQMPIWPLCHKETGCMIGYHSASIIADAYQKGIRGYDISTAYEALKKSAFHYRKDAQILHKKGYIPADEFHESVSSMLEYAYDDWCIAQLAGELGKTKDAKLFANHAQVYKTNFDTETRFFRPKVASGAWRDNFKIYKPDVDFTEATPWQYRFFVPHDAAGLISLYGGQESLVATLDSMFAAPITVDPELPDISGSIGQYVHGNEPSHGIAYLYTYAGQAWKTQKWVRTILKTLYHNTPDGICGNEDCGQMSAWYIMSSLGFYPMCPGDNTYVLTTPLFDKATVRLFNGKKLIIEANNPTKNSYIYRVLFNGQPLEKLFITHQELIQGGKLTFELQSEPLKK